MKTKNGISREHVENIATDMMSFSTGGEMMAKVAPKVYRGIVEVGKNRDVDDVTYYGVTVPVSRDVDEVDEVFHVVEDALAKMLIGLRVDRIVNNRYIPSFISIVDVRTSLTMNGATRDHEGNDIEVPTYDGMQSLYIEAGVRISTYGVALESFDSYINKK